LLYRNESTDFFCPIKRFLEIYANECNQRNRTEAAVGFVQQGIGKIGAEVLILSIGIPINICAKLNICALNSPTSPIPKTLAAINNDTSTMNKRDFPLSLAKDIEQLLKDFRSFEFQNSGLIKTVNKDPYFIYFEDKLDGRFYFRISTPNQTSDFRSFFGFQYFPQNANSFQTSSFNNDSETLKDHFNIWLTLIKDYNSLSFTEEDHITKQYENEFYTDFEIIDEDADVNPFEHDKQVFLYNLLSYIETKLKKADTQDQEIVELISETELLKKSIQNFSKRNTIRKLAKVFAKIKKKGLKLFIDIIDVGKKEIIKKALYGGYEELSNIADKLF
jgi:hypothetical protein